MPGLVRKLLIFAAVDGLVLQPAPPRNHPPATQQAIKIDYKGRVGPLLHDRRNEDTAPSSLEAYGIIGTKSPWLAVPHCRCTLTHMHRPAPGRNLLLPHLDM